MAMLPEYQHQGIGQAVLGQIIKLYRERRTGRFSFSRKFNRAAL